MMRLFFVFLILIIFPFLIIGGAVLAIIFTLLVKLNIIKSPLNLKTKMEAMVKRKKSFTEATMAQISCKHQNLEQKDTVLLCSDCGKIVEHI